MQDITVAELKQRLDAGEELVVIDVREAYEYEEFNIGATLMPLGTLALRFDELEDYKDTELILHCRSGGRSGMAKQMLAAHGFTKARNLLGGMIAWQAAFGKS